MSAGNEKLTLFELASLSRDIEQLLEESNGEVSPEMEQLLAIVTESLPRKVDAVDYALDRLEAMGVLWKKRQEEAYRIKKSYEAAYEGLRALVLTTMTAMGEEELNGVQRRFKLSQLRSLEIDPDKVPVAYKTPVMKMELDRERIKEALDLGKEVPGAKYVQAPSLRRYAKKG